MGCFGHVRPPVCRGNHPANKINRERTPNTGSCPESNRALARRSQRLQTGPSFLVEQPAISLAALAVRGALIPAALLLRVLAHSGRSAPPGIEPGIRPSALAPRPKSGRPLRQWEVGGDELGEIVTKCSFESSTDGGATWYKETSLGVPEVRPWVSE